MLDVAILWQVTELTTLMRNKLENEPNHILGKWNSVSWWVNIFLTLSSTSTVVRERERERDSSILRFPLH